MSSSDLHFKPLVAPPASGEGFKPLAEAGSDATSFQPLWRPSAEDAARRSSSTGPTEEERLEAIHGDLRKDQEAQLEAMEGRLQELVAALGEELERAARERQDRIAERCVDLALKIASRVVAVELERDPSRLVEILRNGLASTDLREGLEIVVNPGDQELMAAAMDSLRPLGVVEVQGDEILAPASLLVRHENQEWEMGVDARMAQVGDEIFEALGKSV